MNEIREYILTEVEKIHTFSLSKQIEQKKKAMQNLNTQKSAKDRDSARKKMSMGDYMKQKKMGTDDTLKKELKKKEQQMRDARSKEIRKQQMDTRSKAARQKEIIA